MTDQVISPLRRCIDRRHDDPYVRATQHDCVQRVKAFVVRRFQLHLSSSGAGRPKIIARRRPPVSLRSSCPLKLPQRLAYIDRLERSCMPPFIMGKRAIWIVLLQRRASGAKAS